MMNRFSNDNSEVISNFHLINNKYNGEVLIKSMKNIDFFFIIEGELLKSEDGENSEESDDPIQEESAEEDSE